LAPDEFILPKIQAGRTPFIQERRDSDPLLIRVRQSVAGDPHEHADDKKQGGKVHLERAGRDFSDLFSPEPE
jgi:hypothetical protein